MHADGWNARTWQNACPVPLRSARQLERRRAANDELQASVISGMTHDGSTFHAMIARKVMGETRIHPGNARRMLAQAESLLLRSAAALKLRERARARAQRLKRITWLPAEPNPVPTDDLLPQIAAELAEYCRQLRDYITELIAASLGTPSLAELATEPAWPLAPIEAEHLERPPDLTPRRAPRAPRAPTRRGAHVAA